MNVLQVSGKASWPGLAARPIVAAEADPPSPDRAELSATPVPNPWPALAAAGALGAGVGGPLGAVLQGPVRHDMLQTLRRLEQAGVQFHERQDRFIFDPGYPAISADEALSVLEENRGDLSVSLPGKDRQDVFAPDLRVLDCNFGAGPQVFSPSERQLWEVTTGLEKAGFKLEALRGRPGTPAHVVDAINRHSRVRFLGSERTLTAESHDQVLAVDFFYGSGKDHPLEGLLEAEQVRAAERSGFAFRSEREDVSGYDIYARKLDKFSVRRGEGVALEVDRAALADLGALGARIDQLDEIGRRLLRPAYKNHDHTLYAFPAWLLESKFSPEVGAAALCELLRAAPYHERPDEAGEVCRALLATSDDEFDLATRTVAVARIYKQSGQDEALKSVQQAHRLGQTRAVTRDQRQAIERLFCRLLSATSSLSGSLQAFDLLRIPVGSESESDRLGIFLHLVAGRPSNRSDEAVDLYRSLLAERVPGEELAPTERRLRRLVAGVQPDQSVELAREAFSFIQAGLRAGQYESAHADELADRFATQLVLHGDPEVALQNLLIGSTSPGAVEDRQDSVLVGGVRVRKKQ